MENRKGWHANPVDTLALNITANWEKGLEIVIEDNGAGPVGAQSSSSGQGLILHSTMMAVIGGSLVLERAPGLPTRLILRLPEGLLIGDCENPFCLLRLPN